MPPFMLMASLTVVALETAPQVAASNVAPATSIERALIERACGTPYTPWAEADAQQCFSEHLLTMRTDFGRDLSKLSAAERKAMDAACRDFRRPERQDAYLDCLSGRLVAIRDRQHRQPGATPALSVDAAAVPASSEVEATAPGPASSWRGAAIVTVTVTGVIAIAGLGFLVVRPRRTRRTCRVCGADAPGADLCTTCRHEAAETVKRALAARLEQASIEEETARKDRTADEEQHDVSLPTDSGVPVAPAVEARVMAPVEEPADVDPVGDRAEECATSRPEEIVPEAETEPVFDPYVVLGVPPGAGQDAIGTAYELAMKRYDPDQVSFLGYEAQEHFRMKVESVERAYQMLSST